MTAVMKACEWITKVAYLNILWIGFTILGLIVIGFFPATASTFTVARKWVTGNTDVPLFKTFYRAYKDALVASNILGYIVVLVGYVLYLDFLFITVAPSDSVSILTIPFLFLSILYFLTALYIFPVYVFFDMKIWQAMKSAFFIMILNPISTIIMALGVFGITYVLWQFQGLAIFFSMSLLSIALMMPAHKAFTKIIDKKKDFHANSLIN